MNGRPRVETFWVVICTDKDGTEGVPAMQGHGGSLNPLYTSNPKLLSSFCDIAKGIASQQGLRCVLAKFSTREDLEKFEP